MKLCWDNIENVRLSKNGNLRDIIKKRTVFLKVCEGCGEEFIGNKNSRFCCKKCSDVDKLNSIFTEEHKRNISISKKDCVVTEEHKRKISNTLKGRVITGDHRKKIREALINKWKNEKHYLLGRHVSEETKLKISDSQRGENANNWKGGVTFKNIPLYDTYAPLLKPFEETRKNDVDMLEVRCTHCGKWFMPTRSNVRSRIQCYNGNNNYKGEHRFYCSDECKHSCPLYYKSAQTLMKEDAVRAGRIPWMEIEREVQPELREMVLERDEHKCVKCGSTEKLCCHHILPVSTNPLESADVDNCMTLCENCHKKVHQQPGCRYNELRTEIC